MICLTQILKKAWNLLWTRTGRERLVYRILSRWGDWRCGREGAGQKHFVYRRPDRIRFLYLKDNAFSKTLYCYKNWELDELRWIVRCLGGRGTFIDGGANIGLFAAFVRQQCPSTRIEAVECLPGVYETLQFVIRQLDLKDIRTHPAALSNHDDQWVKNAWVPGGEECNTTCPARAGEPDVMPTITLSRLLGDHPPAPIVIKLDLEGGEYDALQGLEEYLRKPGAEPPILLVEMYRARFQERGLNFEQWWEWFRMHAYNTYFAGGFGKGPPPGTPLDPGMEMPPVFNLAAIPSSRRAKSLW